MTYFFSTITRHNLPIFLIGAFTLCSCTPTVKVEAPDKPIVVNLNVKVKHEIQRELDLTIKKNDDLF